MYLSLSDSDTLSYFGLSNNVGRAIVPKKSLIEACLSFNRSFLPNATLGPALDAALDILVHGALRNDANGLLGEGRDLDIVMFEESYTHCFPPPYACVGYYAYDAVDALINFLVPAVPQSFYDGIRLVIYKSIERFFDEDRDLHPSDLLALMQIYNQTKRDRSCIIGAMVVHLRNATPLNDLAPLCFTSDEIKDVTDYWERFDFSGRVASPRLMKELAPLNEGGNAQLKTCLQARIGALTISEQPCPASESAPDGDAHERHLIRLYERERRLQENAYDNRLELMRVRARCNLAECLSDED